MCLGVLTVNSGRAAAVSDAGGDLRRNSRGREVVSLRVLNENYSDSLTPAPAIMPKEKPLQNGLLAVVCLTAIGSALLLYNLRK